MNQLPLEILNKCLKYFDDVKIAELCKCHNLITSCASIWSSRTIRIKCRKQLMELMAHKCTQYATRLDFSHSDIDDVDLGFVATHFKRITRINLSYCHEITDDGVESLLKAQGSNLSHLRLKKLFKISNYTMELIQKIKLPKLKFLDLEGTMISSSGLGMLAFADSSIVHLDLSKCHLIDPNMLSESLSQFRHLKTVYLRNLDFLLPFHVESLLSALPTVRIIDVSNCEEMTISFAETMKKKYPQVNLVNTARLEDHSADSVRRYLLSMIAN